MNNQTLIAELRKKQGWTQERLAENCGLSVRTIQRLESGEDASLESLRLVANALNVKVSELFETYKDSNQEKQILEISELQIKQINQRKAKNKLFNIARLLYLFMMIILVAIIGNFTTGNLLIILGVGWALFFILGFSLIQYIRISWWDNKLDDEYPLTKTLNLADDQSKNSDNFLWWKDKTARPVMMIFWGAIIPLIFILKYVFHIF